MARGQPTASKGYSGVARSSVQTASVSVAGRMTSLHFTLHCERQRQYLGDRIRFGRKAVVSGGTVDE